MTDDELRDAVAASRSWRGVLRRAGRSSPRYGRELKARCDELGISYEHFRAGPSDDVVRKAVAGSKTWSDAVASAGYSAYSGWARAQLRRRCALLGLETGHLEPRAEAIGPEPGLEHLRDAGAMLVAACLALHGYAVSWPLEPRTYDLVAAMPEGLQRVQVKTTTYRKR